MVFGARLEVAALPLPPTLRQKLQCAGFRTTGDLEGIQPLDLANGKFQKLFSFSPNNTPAQLILHSSHT